MNFSMAGAWAGAATARGKEVEWGSGPVLPPPEAKNAHTGVGDKIRKKKDRQSRPEFGVWREGSDDEPRGGSWKKDLVRDPRGREVDRWGKRRCGHVSKSSFTLAPFDGSAVDDQDIRPSL